jgi:peptidoglycan/LPS O-acetylase OafA/YrhL
VADDGDNSVMARARPQEEGQTPELPTPAQRRAFKLLPLVWIVVFVLAAVILYAVFN